MNVWNNLKGPRPKNHKPNNTAKPPRTRDNLSGGQQGKSKRMTSILAIQRQMPGGKRYRRAMAALELRQKAYEALKGNAQVAATKPGSMKP